MHEAQCFLSLPTLQTLPSPRPTNTQSTHTGAQKTQVDEALARKKKILAGQREGLECAVASMDSGSLYARRTVGERDREGKRQNERERGRGCGGGAVIISFYASLSRFLVVSFYVSLSLTHTNTNTRNSTPNTHIQAELGDEFEVMHAYGHIVKGMQQLLEKKFDLHPNTTATISFVGTCMCECMTHVCV